MTKTLIGALLAAGILLAAPVRADDHAHGDAAVARAFLQDILATHKAYGHRHGQAFFARLAKGQHPRATVVTCSDSRVHTNMLDPSPEGDLFIVRNIGNQFATARGSVEYGVNHLGSSLLLIIGHSACGAIQAASGDYSGLEPAIARELDTIRIAKGTANVDGVVANVHHQVDAAVADFADKVSHGHLLVVGAVYDFSDDMKHGAGRLNVVNVNGETDPARIHALLGGGQMVTAHSAH